MLARRLAMPVLAADLLVLVLTIWLLWPQHAGGYGLGHDMVFTPHQPLNADSVGLGSGSPRAVPLDALVAIAGKLFGGMLTGRIALLVPLLAAGWGSSRLLRLVCPAATTPALLATGSLAVWNPYLVERLALGQWALLWAYGALPWLVRAGYRIARADGAAVPARDWAGLVCWLAVSAITPTGALIGAAVVVTVAWTVRAFGRTVTVVVAAGLAQLPWLLPALLSSAAATSDPRAVAAFAARAERPGGPLLSLLGLGGIWTADVTPASRAGVLGYLSTLLALLVLVAGIPLLRPLALRRRLVALGLVGLLLAAAGSLPGLSGVLRWTVRELPGAGLLRDGQKWLMPFVLLVVLGAGLATDRLLRLLRSRVGRLAVLLGVAAAVLPLLLLPDAPATLRVPLTPVHYPADWATVADTVRGSSAAVLVLPFSSYRSFDWAPGRTVIDPAPRLLPAPTVVDDRLVVSGTVLAGEDPVAAAVGVQLNYNPTGAAGLGGLGIGWVLVETDTAGPPLPNLTGLKPVFSGSALRLYRVPGQVRLTQRAAATRWLVIGTDLLVAGLVVLALLTAGMSRLTARISRFRRRPDRR
ncbi:MAG TPA: hypothetical protein VJ851_03740 [Jatrophihabitans sp.]|nr:hypothetical protein [Jatrophihabitans sp.]